MTPKARVGLSVAAVAAATAALWTSVQSAPAERAERQPRNDAPPSARVAGPSSEPSTVRAAARPPVGADALFGRWRPVVSDGDQQRLVAALPPGPHGDAARESLAQARRALEARRFEISASSVTVFAPDARPTTHPMQVVARRGSTYELALGTLDGGAPGRVLVDVVGADELRTSLAHDGDAGVMTLRRAED